MIALHILAGSIAVAMLFGTLAIRMRGNEGS